MCLVVYISSNKPILITSVIEKSSGFHIRETEKYERSVHQHFSKRYIYYLGSAEGCGCAFMMDGVYPDIAEFYTVKESYRLLSDFLRGEIENEIIEIYACWIGEENDKPEVFEKISVADLINKDFGFEEGHFYTVEII